MYLSKKNTLRNVFRTVCIFAALLLICYCIHEYALDQDVTHIEYKKFHEEPDQIYPSITICLKHPFIPENLRQIDDNISAALYEDFLSGYQNIDWESSFSEIDYDNVSIDVMNHLTSIKFNLLNNDNLAWYVENNTHMSSYHDSSVYDIVETPKVYVSYRRSYRKCFTINIPFIPKRRIYYMQMNIRDSIFRNGIRPTEKDFFIAMHYPFQFMRSYLLSRVYWEPWIHQTNCYELKVRVGSMEVLRRRNKYHAPCNEDLEEHDIFALTRIIERVGCQPKHWKVGSDLPHCKTKSQYDKAERMLEDVEETLPPCTSIERLITYADGKNCEQRGNFRLIFYFQEPLYKEINVLRAYGFQSLVGNAGSLKYR